MASELGVASGEHGVAQARGGASAGWRERGVAGLEASESLAPFSLAAYVRVYISDIHGEIPVRAGRYIY